MDALGWIPHLFSLEMRKILSYRVDFWLNFLGGVLTEMVIAYFLWSAIFESRSATEMGGYSFQSMIFYYLITALVRRVVMAGEWGFISLEIYEGGLNRYLVYPVSFFIYKYVTWIADASIGLAQLAVTFALFAAIFGLPTDHPVTPTGLLMGTIAVWGASTLYFLLSASLEMVSFWAENVWSLQVMLRFTSLLLGGGMIPLNFFPEWSMPWLTILPFSSLISVPVRSFMGDLSWMQWAQSMSLLSIWCLILSGVVALIWRRGTLQYSGVGI